MERRFVERDDRYAVKVFDARAEGEALQQIRHDADVDDFFARFDGNRDGHITREEMASGLQRLADALRRRRLLQHVFDAAAHEVAAVAAAGARVGHQLGGLGHLLAEGHQRIVYPWLTMVFVLISLSAMLHGDFNRKGHSGRIVGAILGVILVQSFSLALPNMAAKIPSLIILMYLNILLPSVIAVSLMFIRPRRKFTAIPQTTT